MPKKEWTPEERAAFGAKMKAARGKKDTPKVEKDNVAQYDETQKALDESLTGPTKQEEQILTNEEARDLIRRVKELESNFQRSAVKADYYKDKPEVDRRGALIGSFEKYILDPRQYPDPTERLSNEPRLRQFAFQTNYELKFDIATTSYQTLEGVHTKEPRFTLTLVKVELDDNGEPTTKRYNLRSMVLHEDPDAALAIAREQDVEVGDDNKAFLDEMRYLRMRDTLLEWFYPRPTPSTQNGNEEVRDNRVVSIYEVSTPSSSSSPKIPFDQIQKI